MMDETVSRDCTGQARWGSTDLRVMSLRSRLMEELRGTYSDRARTWLAAYAWDDGLDDHEVTPVIPSYASS